MRLNQTFDPTSVPPSERSFELLPTGWYDAQVIETEVVPTKAGTGTMINMTWELMNSEHGKRRIWQRINYQNDSAKAQEIGQQQLAEALLAMGIPKLEDTAQMHFIPCALRVGIEEDKTGQYDPKNKVSGVAPYGYRPGQGQQAQQAPQAARPGIPGRIPGPAAPAPQAAQQAPRGTPRPAPPAAAPVPPPPRQAGQRPAGALPWAR
jgi:hypothetical protein